MGIELTIVAVVALLFALIGIADGGREETEASRWAHGDMVIDADDSENQPGLAVRLVLAGFKLVQWAQAKVACDGDANRD